MDINPSPDQRTFRDEVLDFVRFSLPPTIKEKVFRGCELTRDEHLRWHRILYDKGWIAPRWPIEWGGQGWSPIQFALFDEACNLAGAPLIQPFGVNMLGPVLLKFGSEEQKTRFLPRIRSGDDWWCQGFSEPGAGSDLASLKMRADRDGDHYIVNGQKTWTTLGQHANWIFCLVRTDQHAAKPQRGISMVLIEMDSPGVELRPIITLDGAHEVNEVWFTDVRVPIDQLVGAENEGWTYAKYLLEHERVGIAGVGQSKGQLHLLKEVVKVEYRNGKPLCEDLLFRAKLAQVEIELLALEITNLRMLVEAEQRGGHVDPATASMLKIQGSEIQQRLYELKMEASGPLALIDQLGGGDQGFNGYRFGGDHTPTSIPNYLNFRKVSIYGGSNEIQRNIVAKTTLGF